MLGGSITTRAHLGPPVVTAAGRVNRAVKFTYVPQRTRASRTRRLLPPVVVGAFVPTPLARSIQRTLTRRRPARIQATAGIGSPRVVFGTTYISFGPLTITVRVPARAPKADGTSAATNVSTPVQTNQVTDPYVGWLRRRS